MPGNELRTRHELNRKPSIIIPFQYLTILVTKLQSNLQNKSYNVTVLCFPLLPTLGMNTTYLQPQNCLLHPSLMVIWNGWVYPGGGVASPGETPQQHDKGQKQWTSPQRPPWFPLTQRNACN